MADAEAFLAMGCVEILLHGYDAVVGTDAEFDPDNDLCLRILGRLFPWAPLDADGWRTLLWATDRGELSGQEYLGESWMWHNDLLSEWEGTIRRLSSTDQLPIFLLDLIKPIVAKRIDAQQPNSQRFIYRRRPDEVHDIAHVFRDRNRDSHP